VTWGPDSIPGASERPTLQVALTYLGFEEGGHLDDFSPPRVLLDGLLSWPDDLAVVRDPVFGRIVGQHRVAASAAVDEIIFSAPALAGVDVIPTAAAVESVGVALADERVCTTASPERVVLSGSYQPIGTVVADFHHGQGRAGENDQHQAYYS
jgi:hypothetical protein